MTIALDLDASERIAQALVAAIASELGARSLAIKGHVSDHYGLRKPRVAADADVMVEPRYFEDICHRLESRGWHQRVARETPSLLPQHSATFIHPHWPCDIDVHWMFPGFFAPADEAFEALWRTHRSMELAHRTITIPSRAGAAVVAALHSRRNARSLRHVEEGLEIDRVVASDFSRPERDEFYEIAAAGGAIWVLRDLIASAELGPLAVDADPRDQEMWSLNRIFADEGSALSWWLQAQSAPWYKRPAVLMRALWVPRGVIPRNDERHLPSRKDSLNYQFYRWKRGASAIYHYVKGKHPGDGQN